jgi:glycosyltransferase involved in cell wall biosynthesis
MRILYSHRIQSRDGQSVHVEELVAAFRRLGHEVLVVGPSLYERAEFGGDSRLIAALRRTVPGALLELAEIGYNVLAFLRLRRAYRRFAPDFVYERYNLYYLAGLLLRRWYRTPYYLEINSPLAEERARFGALALAPVARRLERLVWRSADRVFVVTRVLAEIAAAAGVPDERITVTPNGIDPEVFAAQPYRARPGAAITIGFVGFVRDWHGLDGVIAGLAAEPADPPIRLIIAGDGPVRSALERQAAALGIAAHVHFAGFQPRQAMPDLIRRFDIALQPRAVPYASPLKLFEYMACGCAIVAPDQPNIREILTNGVDALLFDPDDPQALWRAIRRLARDPELRERLGEGARHTLVARNLTWQGNALRITAAAAQSADGALCSMSCAEAG